MTAFLLYVVLLPLWVWLLGNTMALLDHDDYVATLGRVAWRALPLLAIALVLGSSAARPMIAALVTVLALHLAWFAGLRWVIRRGLLAEPPED
jgi:hypothetical protein